jgi:serine/threonine-protein kinase
MPETNGFDNSAMLPVGTLLQDGKYRIERYLSSGGFGNTYVATNTEFEEQVAIKEFFMRGISDRNGDSVSVSVSNKTNVEQFTSQKEKFRKEARRLRKLRNPHIVAVHDLFEENGTAYYEMDLIKGESLSERMKRSGQPLGEAEVLQILDQVLDALSVVHAQGLYHLDLKPANIMVDQTGRALLIDFGASKQMSAGDGYSVSTSSALSFTPGYAPLEQTEQNMKAFGPWTDLYALGATLYKLLTGLTPPSASELLVSRKPLVFPTPVSSKMQQLIAWMMKPAYVDRPQSVSDVRQFLTATQPAEEETRPVEPDPVKEETLVIEKPQPKPQPKPEPKPEPIFEPEPGHLQNPVLKN